MYAVKTDHQIVPFGTELMRLFDRDGGELVKAERAESVWTIHAEGIDDVTAADREAAINALVEHARRILPGYPDNGFSTFLPTGIFELP